MSKPINEVPYDPNWRPDGTWTNDERLRMIQRILHWVRWKENPVRPLGTVPHIELAHAIRDIEAVMQYPASQLTFRVQIGEINYFPDPAEVRSE